MHIRIDPNSGVPIWQQIVQQVTRQVLSGNLQAGEQLQTVRELASELRVNPNTVARAYQDLERDGIVETRRGLGTFACDPAGFHQTQNARAIIEERVDSLFFEASQFRMTPDEVAEIFRARVQKIEAERTNRPRNGTKTDSEEPDQ